MIECDKDKCKERDIGQTGRLLKFRIAEQRAYILIQVVTNRCLLQPARQQPGKYEAHSS